MVPRSVPAFLELVRKSGLLEGAELEAYLRKLGADLPEQPKALAKHLVRDGVLTTLQANLLLQGKHRGFHIEGKYKLLAHLGSGGMGIVYLCEHLLLQRLVAIKALRADRVSDETVGRFLREARAVGRLDHPNLARVHDVLLQHGLPMLVMEYVDGTSLHDLVQHRGRLDVPRAVHYVTQAALALHHAHQAGLIHRDVKPANLYVDRLGTVKVLDLGLARFFDDPDWLARQLDDKIIVGTADFLAPEQAASGAVDGRADVYGLGASFYFLLAGRPPFVGGTTREKLLWHQVRQPLPVRLVRPDVPAELDAVLARMMAKDPADRYPSCAEAAAALGPWHQGPAAPPEETELPSLDSAILKLGRSPASGSPSSVLLGAASSTRLAGSSTAVMVGDSSAVLGESPFAPPDEPAALGPRRWLPLTGAIMLAAGLAALAAAGWLWWAAARPGLHAGTFVFVEEGQPRDVVPLRQPWQIADEAYGSGEADNDLFGGKLLGPGDFIVCARLRLRDPGQSAAAFRWDDNLFGFDGADGGLFVEGPVVNGHMPLRAAPPALASGGWVRFEAHRIGEQLAFMLDGDVVHRLKAPGPVRRVGFRPLRGTLQLRHFALTGTVRTEAFTLP